MEEVLVKTNKIENLEKIKTKVERNSNLEILRIFAMIMIIAHHYILHSSVQLSDATALNKVIISFLELGGKLGVNIFILITGYFLIEKQYNSKKVIKLVIKVLTYSMICLIIAVFTNSNLLNIVNIVTSFFPVMMEEYWFMTTYILIYLFHPYINKLFFTLEKKEIEKVLLVLFAIWSLVPTFTLGNFGCNALVWFVFIYLLGGYFKIYGNKFLENKKKNIISIVIVTIILTLIPIGLANCIKEYQTNKHSINNGFSSYFLEKTNDVYYFNSINSAFILILSISYFSLFKNKKMKTNKVINSISAHTLGIYLMHDNPFMRNLIWNDIVHCSWYIKSNIFIVNALCTIPIIFITCLIIDYTTEKIFENNIYRIIENKYLNKQKDTKS